MDVKQINPTASINRPDINGTVNQNIPTSKISQRDIFVKLKDTKELGEGFENRISSRNTPKTVSNTLIPLLSIRPRQLYNGVANRQLIIPDGYGIQTDNAIELRIFLNATLTGASRVDVDTENSGAEYDVSATDVSGGIEIAGSYIATGSRNTTSKDEGILGRNVISYSHGGTQDVLTICAIRTSTSDAEVYSNINWREIR